MGVLIERLASKPTNGHLILQMLIPFMIIHCTKKDNKTVRTNVEYKMVDALC